MSKVALKGLLNAWLSPDGELIVDANDFEAQAWHEQLAACIIRDRQGLAHRCDVQPFIEAAGCEYAYAYLEERGWIRLHSWQGAGLKWIASPIIPSAQREVIEQWCQANGKQWDEVVEVIY